MENIGLFTPTSVIKSNVVSIGDSLRGRSILLKILSEIRRFPNETFVISKGWLGVPTNIPNLIAYEWIP